MTNEERHIAVLNRMLESMDVYDSIQPTTERKKAIKAAIKALEQQPCDDTISRQAACDAIRIYKSVVSKPDAYDKAFDDGIDTAIAEIGHNVPPVTPQPQQKYGKWIRVTDKTGHLVWECNKCGWQQRFNTNFCPECGAKMQESEEE